MNLEDTAGPSREGDGPQEASPAPTGEGRLVDSTTQGLGGGSRDGTGRTEAGDLSVRYGECWELVEVDDTETISRNLESDRVLNYITGTFGCVEPASLARFSSPSLDSSRRTP